MLPDPRFSWGDFADCEVPTLSVDRGNSTYDLLFSRGGLVERVRLPVSGDGLAEQLKAWCPERVVALSVVAGGLDSLRDLLAPSLLFEAGVDLSNPLEHSYADPSRLGVDRWVGAVAAQRDFGDACIVDCGTAVTVNAVSAAGDFLGGAIAPGAGTMARGLADHAPALPVANLRAKPGLPANSSNDAVDCGVILGFAGLVDRLAEGLLESVGLPHATRLVTGGHAELLLAHSRAEWLAVPELNHRGLRWLLSDHVSKS